MIEVRDVTKRFGPALAVDRVSFAVGRSEVVGFLGPNGAGKSTTMRVLTGYLPASEGEALVDGFAVSEKPREVRRRIGYLPENNPLYEDLRVREYLYFRAALKGVPRKERRAEVDRVLSACEVGDAADRIIGVCSKGYRQRVGLADALLGDPPVLVLDEPTVGLDPQQIVHVRNLIKELAKDHTVILSTHVLPEVEAICSRALIIHRGRICFDGSVDDLRAGLVGGAVLSCEVAGDPEAARACLASVAGVEHVEEVSRGSEGAAFSLFCEKGTDVRRDVFWACSRASLPLLAMTAKRASVEEAFLDITTQEAPKEVPE
jgi:ABC-2 type transport system ATP-binding protein